MAEKRLKERTEKKEKREWKKKMKTERTKKINRHQHAVRLICPPPYFLLLYLYMYLLHLYACRVPLKRRLLRPGKSTSMDIIVTLGTWSIDDT